MIHGRNGTAKADAATFWGNRPGASWDAQGLESHGLNGERYAEAVVLGVFIAVAMVSNASLCAVILRKSTLRQMSNLLFIVNLCVADMLVSIIVMPITILTLVRGRWIFSEHTCKVMGYISMLLLVSSVMSLAVMSVNRYIKICKPHTYRRVYTSFNIFLMSLGVWILSAALSSPPLLGWGMYNYLPRQSICFCDWSTSRSYTFFMISACFGCPLVIMAVCNAKVLHNFSKSRRRLQHHAKTAEEQRQARRESVETIVRSVTTTLTEETVGSVSVTSVTPTRQQEVEREQKKAQHDSEHFRLAVSVMVMIAVFILCWFPYCVSMFLSLFAPHLLSHATDMPTLLLGFSNSCFNPTIYGLMNKRVRSAYFKAWNDVRRALC